MTPEQAREQLEALRHRLVARLGRIERDIQRQGSERPVEIGDAASLHQNDEVLDHLSEAERRELSAIDAALERIALGTWGLCARCGEAIEPARLEALPWTPWCAACAREMEAAGGA